MKMKISEVYNAVVVDLKGNIMGGPEASELNTQLHNMVDQGKKHIVIDLGEVAFMNSSGLGMLISCLTTVKNAGGELKLANATEKIQSLLIITKLVQIFENYDSVAKAIESFKKN